MALGAGDLISNTGIAHEKMQLKAISNQKRERWVSESTHKSYCMVEPCTKQHLTKSSLHEAHGLASLPGPEWKVTVCSSLSLVSPCSCESRDDPE